MAEVNVRLIAFAGAVIARVIERNIHAAISGIYREPLVEPIDQAESIGHGLPGRPRNAVVVREGCEDVGRPQGSDIHPGAMEATAVRTAAAIGVAGRILQCSAN